MQPLGVLCAVTFLLLVLGAFVFWIRMIIDCATKGAGLRERQARLDSHHLVSRTSSVR